MQWDTTFTLFNDSMTNPVQATLTGSRFDQIVAVSGGFRPFYLWSCFGKRTKEVVTSITTYDVSAENLNVWETIVRTWDGDQHLGQFVTSITGKSPVTPTEFATKWPATVRVFGSDEHFVSQWRAFQRLEHRFVHCDLLDADGTQLVRAMPEESLLWVSDIFSNPKNLRAMGQDMMRQQMRRLMRRTAPECIVLGTLPNGRFVAERAEALADSDDLQA